MLAIPYSGIKFIPLKTPGGELILESGLFVRIKKTSTTTQSDGHTQGLHHEQPGNDEEPSLNGDNQIICDAEVYENQFINIDD